MNFNSPTIPAMVNKKPVDIPSFLKPGIRLFILVISLFALTFATANFYKNATWGLIPLVLVLSFLFTSMLASGISIYSIVFATIALLPNLNSFLPLGFFSLTWIEVFMVLAVYFFLKKPVYLTKIGLLSIGLYLSCIFSLIGSPLGFLSFGIMLRFGILLLFVNLLIIQKADPLLFKAFFYGLLMIPFTACMSYAGEGVLGDIFSANLLEFSRAVYSFQYPIWFALVMPLLVYIKTGKIIKVLFAAFVGLLFVLSFSRSIIIGTGMATLFYIFFYKDKKLVARMITKTVISMLIVVVIFIVTVVLKFLEFNNMDNESNVARYEKMPIAFNKFKQHPFFGVGFGASNDKAFAEKRSMSEVFQEQISAEFGPLTAMSEIGGIGSFFLFYLIGLSVYYSMLCIKKKEINASYKLVILIAFGGLVSSFLNSNSLASIIVYLFIAIPLFFYKNTNEQVILQTT